MAEQNNNDRRQRAREMNEMNQAGSEFLDILKQMRAEMKNLQKDIGDTAGEQQDMNNSTDAALKLARKLSSFSAEDLKSKSKRKSFEDLHQRTLSRQTQLEEKILKLVKKGGTESEKKIRILQDQLQTSRELTQEANKLTAAYTQIDSSVKFFDGISEVVGEIPIIRKLLPEFKKAAENARDVAAETGNMTKSITAGLKEMTGGLLKLGATTAFGFGIKGIKELDERIVSTRVNFNLTAREAQIFQQQLLEDTQGTFYTAKELYKTAEDLSGALGTGAIASTETLKVVDKMTHKLGLSAEEAANLYRFSSLNEDSFANQSKTMIGQLKLMNSSTKENIRYQDVLKDISKASSATLLTTQKFPGGIAKAAFQARKLGMSMSQLNSISESLLDFENSIASEMEAEMLLGRDLNLNAAREAALRGDTATLAAELAKNVGSAAEFSDMSVIQQQALAKAMGMSRDELADTLVQQEALQKIAKERKIDGFAQMTMQQQLAALEKQGLSREQALRELGKDELADKEKSITAQEALAHTMQQMTEGMALEFSKLTGEDNPLGKLGDTMKNDVLPAINDLVRALELMMAMQVGQTLMGGFRGVGKMFKGLTGKTNALKTAMGKGLSAKQIQAGFGGKDAMAQLAKQGGPKGAANIGKSLGKGMKFAGGALKGLGSVARVAGKAFAPLAIGMSIFDGFKGFNADKNASFGGKLKNAGSSILSGLTFGLLGKSANEIKAESNVEDFTIKPLAKDTITMAGGTKLGGNVEALLEELISIVKGGGDVYLDGSKVGSTLVLNSKLSN